MKSLKKNHCKRPLNQTVNVRPFVHYGSPFSSVTGASGQQFDASRFSKNFTVKRFWNGKTIASLFLSSSECPARRM